MPYTYEDIETLIGLLKQSAIDATMCQGGQGYWSKSPTAEWQISGDKKHYERNEVLGRDSRLDPRLRRGVVLRPDSRGGGSQGERWDDGEFVGTPYKVLFEQIRSAIDLLVDPWKNLPDPTRINDVVVELERAHAGLLIDSIQIVAAKTGIDEAAGAEHLPPSQDATLTSAIVTMLGESQYLHGATASVFKTYYLNTVEAKVKSLGKVALELYVHVLRQKAMWNGARQDVKNILNECRLRFDMVAKGRSDDWTQELAILRVINDMVGAGTSGPVAGLATKAAEYGLDAAASTPVDSQGLGTYDEVLAGLRKRLEALNTEIKNQEDGIRRWAVDRLDEIWTHRGNYRLRGGVGGAPGNSVENSRGAAALHFDEIDERDEFRVGSDSDIKWDFTIAAGIATSMDNFAGLLKGVANFCSPPEVVDGIRSSVVRNVSVGVGGGYGPSQVVQELDEVLYELLENMAGDWEAVAENLRAASNYFEAVEEGNVGQLDTLRQGVDAAADDVLDGTGIKIHDYRNISWWERMGGG